MRGTIPYECRTQWEMMAHREVWLIDGCNLLHACKDRSAVHKKFGSNSALFDELNDFAASQSVLILVVLDGGGQNAEFEAYRTDLLDIRFAQNISVDTYIERFLYDRKLGALAVVVTDDRAVCSMARGFGCRSFKVKDFLAMLGQTEKDRQTKLFFQSAKSHGFNRPFDHLLDKKGQ